MSFTKKQFNIALLIAGAILGFTVSPIAGLILLVAGFVIATA